MENMENKYNLLEEPWIDVMGINNNLDMLGVKQILLEAHNLLQITDSSLLMQYGIYRFLIAFISDMLDIVTLDDLENILEQGSFPSEIIENYCSEQYPKFYLFSEENPFYQNPKIKERNKRKSVANLIQFIPSGNNAIHFYHGLERDQAISPPICAKALCALTPFTPIGGRGYKASINKKPPWYILIRGRNLFEMLLLNCAGIHIDVNDNDAPVLWNNPHIDKKDPVQQTSTLQGLTWLPRYVYLYPDKEGICTYSGKESDILVSEIELEQAWSFDGTWIDPHISYIRGKKGLMPLVPIKGKSLWRDIGPLMLMTEDSSNSPHEVPIVVKQLKSLNLYKRFLESGSLVVQAYGILTDQAKYLDWSMETLSLPLKILMDRYLEFQVQPAIDLANQVERILYSTIKFFAQKNDTINNSLKSLCITEYWRSLEKSFKEDFLVKLENQDLDNIDARGELQDHWKKTLRNTARDMLEIYLGEMGTNATFLKRKVEAIDFFMKRLFGVLFPNKKNKKS